MSRERGVLASFLLKKKNPACVANNSSSKPVLLLQADEWLLSYDARRKTRALPPYSSAAALVTVDDVRETPPTVFTDAHKDASQRQNHCRRC